MGTYAIGDLQGCYVELLDLLNEINFDEKNDRLWFVGDLVNRGPMSLDCLEFVMSLNDAARTVLGNHELHLLAVANQTRKLNKKDTFQEIFTSEHLPQLLDWIKKQRLFFHDPDCGFAMLHAGLPPQWELQQAIELANETEALIQSDDFPAFLEQMYGNLPDKWSEKLDGYDRHRFIINCFTRLRYITKNGKLDFSEKGAPGSQSDALLPWYAHPDRKTGKTRLLFGHWSTVTLGQEADFIRYNVYPLDTGCIWGGKLTALRLEDEKFFSVPSRQPKINK